MSLVFGQLLHLSRSLAGATASVSPSLRTSVTSLTGTAPARLFHLSAPIYKDHTKRKNFTILREPPLGPYKLLAPGVQSKWFEKRKGKKNRIGPPGNYRYRVKYPEDGQYTIKKLEIQKLGGRDPVTGRKVIQGVGGGSKQKFRWVDPLRIPEDWPKDKELIEKVLSINYDPMRTSCLALTGYADKLRWQLATTNMKAGDLIRSTTEIPEMAVKPLEGNSHPLGALPVGTEICMVQSLPGGQELMIVNGDDSGEILRKSGDRVVIRSNNGLEYSLHQTCQCVVGKVSIHHLKKIHIGSPNRLRWMGFRPRSGLWQRRDGRFGRKIKKPPPVQEINPPKKTQPWTEVLMNCPSEGTRGRIAPRKRKFQRQW